MSKALTIFDSNKLAPPSHVADAFADEKNITERNTVPSLSYEGKVWTVSINGEKTKYTKKDEDGEQVPVQTLRVAVLDFAKRRGRAYYEGAYDPAKPGSPLCWSEDGVKPHENVEAPQCASCDKCPMAAKGSKITEQGKAIAACSQHRMVVVAPLNKLDMPLRMKLAITSDWDKQNPDLEKQGWFAFNNYTDFLRAKGISHTAAVVTKMKFDPNAVYPKVIFSPDRWLTEDEVAIVKPIIKSDEVKQLLSGTWTPAGVDGVKIDKADDDEDDAPPPKAAKKPVDDDDEDDDDDIPVAPVVKSKAKAKVVEDDDDDVEVIPPPKAKKKAAPVEDDDEDVVPPPAKKPKGSSEPKAEPKKAAKTKEPAAADTDVPGDVAALLDDWGDD